jgi:hypothetical protein
MIKTQHFLLLFILIIWFTIFSNEYPFHEKTLNLAYAHIFSGTPNSVFKEKDGYRIAFLPYPAIPKIGDNNTLLNFNVQKDGNDVTNIFISLIIMNKESNKIVHQFPYKFHEFADTTYSYSFQNQSKYSLSLLTKIAGDPKYENNPLIVSFDIEVSNYYYNNNALLVTILFFVAFSIIIAIIFVPNFRKQISGFFEQIFIKK